MWRIVQKNVHSGRSIQAPAVLLQWSHGLTSWLGIVDDIGKKGLDTVWQNFLRRYRLLDIRNFSNDNYGWVFGDLCDDFINRGNVGSFQNAQMN